MTKCQSCQNAIIQFMKLLNIHMLKKNSVKVTFAITAYKRGGKVSKCQSQCNL